MFDQERLKRIDAWMSKNEQLGRISGSSLLLAHNGKAIHKAFSGLRSVERNLPYKQDTIARIYSMTKPVVAVAFMQLVERGLVHLDASLSDFIPEFAECFALKKDAQSIDDVVRVGCPTLHQLLTHTSGLTYDFNAGILPTHYKSNGINFDPGSGGLQQMVQKVAKQPLVFAPGARWEYSIGMDVVGAVIEIITGNPLDQVLRDTIFEPLGMTDTAFALTDDKKGRFADCYTKSEGLKFFRSDAAESSEFHKDQVTTLSGGGGLVSTLEDYFHFAEMLRQHGSFEGTKILSPSTVSFMMSNHLAGDISAMGPTSFAEMPMTGMGFGIGGAVVINPARTRILGSKGDFGWGGLANTYFWIDPKNGITCVFFTQLKPSSSYPLRAELKSLVHSALEF